MPGLSKFVITITDFRRSQQKSKSYRTLAVNWPHSNARRKHPGTGDIISLHSPLTAETHHLMNAEPISRMKATALLLNTARGGLVDTVALAGALSHAQIAGAALDVFEQEPLHENPPLRKCENVILTSHVAWYREMSVPELQRMAAQVAVRALGGEAVPNRVG